MISQGGFLGVTRQWLAVRVEPGPEETSVFTFLKCLWLLKPCRIYYLSLFQRKPGDWHFTGEEAEAAK